MRITRDSGVTAPFPGARLRYSAHPSTLCTSCVHVLSQLAANLKRQPIRHPPDDRVKACIGTHLLSLPKPNMRSWNALLSGQTSVTRARWPVLRDAMSTIGKSEMKTSHVHSRLRSPLLQNVWNVKPGGVPSTDLPTNGLPIGTVNRSVLTRRLSTPINSFNFYSVHVDRMCTARRWMLRSLRSSSPSPVSIQPLCSKVRARDRCRCLRLCATP